MTQYPNFPDCGGVQVRSGRGVAQRESSGSWMRCTEPRTTGSTSRQFIHPSQSCRGGREQDFSCIIAPEQPSIFPAPHRTLNGSSSCPLPCHQSTSDSPPPPFPLAEITQGVVNSSSMTCSMTTLHQRTRIWPFILTNMGE